MSDPSNPLRLEAVGVLRNTRRRYDPASKQRLVEACLQPGVSLAGVALRHGVNANLLRKWVAGQQRQHSRLQCYVLLASWQVLRGVPASVTRSIQKASDKWCTVLQSDNRHH